MGNDMYNEEQLAYAKSIASHDLDAARLPEDDDVRAAKERLVRAYDRLTDEIETERAQRRYACTHAPSSPPPPAPAESDIVRCPKCSSILFWEAPPPPASEAEPWGSRRSECNCRTGDGPGLHDDGCNVTLPPEPPETKAPRARRNRSRDEDRNETAEGS